MEKKMIFFKICFLKAELKSEDILYSGGSGLSVDIYVVGFYLCFDVISPIPKTFQPAKSLPS